MIFCLVQSIWKNGIVGEYDDYLGFRHAPQKTSFKRKEVSQPPPPIFVEGKLFHQKLELGGKFPNLASSEMEFRRKRVGLLLRCLVF